MKRLILFLLLAAPVAAQVDNPSIIIVNSDPSGTTPCNLPWRWNALGTGNIWYHGGRVVDHAPGRRSAPAAAGGGTVIDGLGTTTPGLGAIFDFHSTSNYLCSYLCC